MNNHQQQEFQQNMQMGSGLTRYRSAPSSYFSSFLDTPTSDGAGFGAEDFEQLFNPRASSPETQRIFSRFMNSAGPVQENCSSNLAPLPSQSQLNSQFLPPTKTEPDSQQPQQQLQRHQSNDYSSASQMVYQSQDSVENSYNKSWGSCNSKPGPHMKMEAAAAATADDDGGGGGGGGGGGNYSLIRHSSSPAGLFANINIENEFGIMRDIETFGGRNNANAEVSFLTSASKFKSQMDDRQFDRDRGNDASYIPGFPVNSWDDSAVLSDNFLKELADDDSKSFSNANVSDDQNNEGGNRPTTMLSHHLSLPKSSAEQSAMEKLLQDSVPCKIRAKRGFATHPRSIAERVRRTKISDRMKKLQDLVPNMEKQTSTSDMLDLAVDYIKDLQRQVKTLSDNQAKCSCSAKQGS